MKENFNVKEKNGSIAIFVLVGLLFMSSFLIISFSYNVNKSKIAKEQLNIISEIYSHKDGDANAYERAYTALRKKNKQTLTASVENSSDIELTKTFEENLVNYRIYGAGNEETYQQIEYIEGTGKQYIDTGFIPNSNTTIEMKLSNDSTTNATLYCARGAKGATDKSYTAFFINGNSLRLDYYDTMYSNCMTITRGNECVYKQDKNLVYVDGQLVKTLNESNFSSEHNMYLMAAHNGEGSGVSHIGNIKLYYCKIWDNGTLVRDFVPYYRESDGAAGLYDLVNGVFYSSNTTTGFIAGEEISNSIINSTNSSNCLGNLISNEFDSNYGKYRIKIKITNSEEQSTTTEIILNKPLFKEDYIDFKMGKVIRNDGTAENLELPEIITYEDYTEIEVLSDVVPSKIELEYVGYTLE